MKHRNWWALLARVVGRGGSYRARYRRAGFREYNMLIDLQRAGLVERRRSYWSGMAHRWLATEAGERWLLGRELVEMEASLTFDGGR